MDNVYDLVSQYGLYGLITGSDRGSNGSTFYVDGNSGTASNAVSPSTQGTSWDTPFSTLNYAISRCTSDAGDTIFVAAGHTETIADTGTASGTTTDELVVDKSRIMIIGMGVGTDRPTFTLNGATDAAMVVLAGADNVVVKNLIFVSGIADLAAAITVSATSDGFVCENCEFRDGGAANLEMVLAITLAANADDCIIRGCRFLTTDAGSSTASAINLVGAAARLQILDNFFRGDWNTSVITNSAAAATDILIKDNVINNLDAATGICIDLHASTTGAVIHNLLHGGLNGTSPLDTTAALAAENYYTNAEAASAAILTPATDS